MEDIDELIGAAIGRAARHAQRVRMREHIKANRIDAVNQFIVSLRRELILLNLSHDSGRTAFTILLDARSWHDIGIPTLESQRNQSVRAWMTAASRNAAGLEAQASHILADIEELDRNLAAIESLSEEAREINLKGEKLSNSIYEIYR